MLKEQLKTYRKNLGLKQEEIANKLGITRQCYAHYEQGAREPSIDILKKLCIIFNCTSDELLELDNPTDRKKVVINHSFNNYNNINFKA